MCVVNIWLLLFINMYYWFTRTLYLISSVNVVMLCSGSGSLWDDCERLPEEGSDDARAHSRVLCSVQDTRWVSRPLALCTASRG